MITFKTFLLISFAYPYYGTVISSYNKESSCLIALKEYQKKNPGVKLECLRKDPQ